MNGTSPRPFKVISGRQEERTGSDQLADFIPTPTINPGEALRDMRLDDSLHRMLTGKFRPLGITLEDGTTKDRYTGVERRYTIARGAGLEIALLQIPRWIVGSNNHIDALVPLGSAFANGTVRILSQREHAGAFGLRRVLQDWERHYKVRARFVPWSFIQELDEGTFGPEEILELELKRKDLAQPAPSSPQVPDPAGGERTIEIFLASSAELREDRDAFDLYFRQQNDRLRDRGVYLKIVRWENFLDAMSETRLQDEYNEAVRSSEIFVSLFKTKTGRFTEEEFDTAHRQFQATGKPRIYTFFRKASVSTTSGNRDDLKSLWDFQDKLKALGHFYTEYEDVDDLKLKFRDQLDRLLDDGGN